MKYERKDVIKPYEDYNENLAYVFGNDANPFCSEINFVTNEQTFKGAPIGLKLKHF